MKAARRVLGVVGDVCITLGAVLLFFVAWQLWWTDLTANRVQAGTVQTLTRDFSGGPATERPAPVAFGKAFAIVRIPRLGSDYARPVLEGTGREVLQQGIGHYQGTALPGTVGNFAVAGHRTTYGRPFHDIDTLRPGDRVIVETQGGYSVYQVKRHRIVDPSDVAVIAAVPEHPGVRPAHAWMTMTACHPKYSAAQRYVVFAELVHTYTRAQGLPQGTLAVPAGR